MNHVRIVESPSLTEAQAKANSEISLNNTMSPINITHSYVPEIKIHVLVILFGPK